MKDEGADFNSVDYNARSALHIACINGHLNVVKFLLKESKIVISFIFTNNIGVFLDKIDSSGSSPLYHSIKKGHNDIAILLYFKGASVHAPKEKLAKMLCLCGMRGDVEKVKLLNECESDLEISDYDLRTVAHIAAAEGHFDLLYYLI